MSAALADSLMPFCAAPQRFLLDIAQDGAPLPRFRLHDEHFAVVCEPETFQAVMNGSPDDFEKGGLYDIMRTSMGDGLVTCEHTSWRMQHALLAPLFARRRLRELEALIAARVSALLDAWQAHSGSALELMTDCKRFAFDVVCHGLLGLDDAALADELFTVTTAVDRAESVRIYYLAKRFRSSGAATGFARSAVFRTVDHMEALTFDVVDRRLKLDTQPDDLLGAAIASDAVRALDAGSRRRFLRDLVGTFLIAGYSTTGESLFWTLYLLARHSDAQRRAYDAAIAHTAGDKSATRFDAPPYLGALFNEALRLYPPVWFIGRIARKPIALHGETLDAGTRLLCSPLVLQQLPRLWPEPMHFKPERFLPNADVPLVPRAFVPFGTGMRACIGRGLALMEMAALVGSALRRFEFALVSQEPPVLTAAFATQPRDPVHFTLQPRA